MLRWTFCFAMALMAVVAEAAPVQNGGFEKVPPAALKALAVTRGKAFNSGLVFVNGKLVPPPYVVSRYGTAIVVNDRQVTGQIIPWSKFQGTQKGASSDSSSDATSVDDLFDDSGFVMNSAAKSYLDSLNKARTKIDRALRDNKFFFFGTRYSRLDGEERMLRELLKVLPETLRDAKSGEDIFNRLHRAGVMFLSPAICTDLYANRFDYLTLMDVRQKFKEKVTTDSILMSGDSLTL